MKTIVLVVLTMISVVSCSENDDNNTTQSELEGTWTLTNVFCFCAFGDDPDFSGHKITFEGNNLEVENTGAFEFLVNAEGTYTLVDKVLTLQNGQQYTYKTRHA